MQSLTVHFVSLSIFKCTPMSYVHCSALTMVTLYGVAQYYLLISPRALFTVGTIRLRRVVGTHLSIQKHGGNTTATCGVGFEACTRTYILCMLNCLIRHRFSVQLISVLECIYIDERNFDVYCQSCL